MLTRWRVLAVEFAAQVALALVVGLGASLVFAGAALLLAGATPSAAQAEQPAVTTKAAS